MNLDTLFQFESHLESAFKGILQTATPNVYLSRSTDDAQSPRLDIRASVVEGLNHSRLAIDGVRFVYDTYTGEIEVKVVTNRTSEEKSNAHNILKGQVRARLQQYYVTQEWTKQNSPLLIMDVREASNTTSEADEDDLDTSILTYAIIFSISPNAWPTNL